MIKRKILFIKKSVQLQLMLLILLCFLLGVGFASYEAVTLMEKVFASHPALMQVFFEEGSSIFYFFIIKIVICFAILAMITAVLSNKFAGPLYRFEQVCKNIAKGNISERVILRDGDAMRELQKEFNEMMDALEKKIKDLEKSK